jgi:hypothetical protein
MEIRLELDEQLVRRVEQISKEGGCSVADVTAAALDLFVRLPGETVESLSYVITSGSPADIARLTSAVGRAITDAEYELSYRQVVASIPASITEGLESEGDIIAEAVRLTSRPCSSDTRSDR